MTILLKTSSMYMAMAEVVLNHYIWRNRGILWYG